MFTNKINTQSQMLSDIALLALINFVTFGFDIFLVQFYNVLLSHFWLEFLKNKLQISEIKFKIIIIIIIIIIKKQI